MKYKKTITIGAVMLLVVGMATAGLLGYFGQITTDVDVTRAITLTGTGCTNNICSQTIVMNAGETAYSNDYTATSTTSVDIPVEIETLADVGLTETVEYNLHAEADNPRESRIVIKAADAGLTDLNSLLKIEFEQYVSAGYVGHVDVKLSDKTLVFEYAKVDASDCDDAGDYPTGSVSTFGDKGIVDAGAYAWLSSGVAGYCGLPEFDNNHKTLAQWKSTDGSKAVIALEFEVDSWIAESTGKMYDIKINDVLQDVVYVEANSNVKFDLKIVAANDLETESYEITSEVVPQ